MARQSTNPSSCSSCIMQTIQNPHNNAILALVPSGGPKPTPTTEIKSDKTKHYSLTGMKSFILAFLYRLECW